MATSLFSRPETVLRSHLSERELVLFDSDDPAEQAKIIATPPSLVAFGFRHWVHALSLVPLALLSLAGLIRFVTGSAGRFGYFVCGVAMVLLVIDIVLFEIRLFFRTYTRYVITPERVIRMDGILDRRSASIEWDKITDRSFYAGVAGQTFDYGDITIETANENSSFGSLEDVPQPRKFLKEIDDARAKKQTTPVSVAALKALIALEDLLTRGGLVVEPSTPEGQTGWTVRRETTP